MRDALDAIEGHLQRLGRERLLARLQPGLLPGAARPRLASIGLAAPASLLALYEWRNGTKVTPGESLDDIHLFPGFYLASLDEAIANHQAFKADPRWSRPWLPLFGNGGGDFYVVDMTGQHDPDAPVLGFLLGEPATVVEYEGIEPMVRTIAECYAEGAFFVDDRGFLEVDDDLHASIAERYNPRVELWRDV